MGFAPELLKTVAGLQKKITVSTGSEVVNPGRVPTGSLSLDIALGGGWPAGQWSEIIGDPSNGKSAVCLKTIAHNQAVNPEFVAVWVAAEPWFPEWAETVGIDNDRVIVIQTTVMEEAYDAVIELATTKAVDLIVIDSLPAMVSMAEDDKTMEEFTVGRGAMQTNKFFRKISRALMRDEGEKQCACILINQFRMKIGVMHGDPRTTPGGMGKDYAMSVRVEVKRVDWIEKGKGTAKRKIGLGLRAQTIKNKTAPPQQTAFMDFYVDEGGPVSAGSYDTGKEIWAQGVVHGIVERRGAWYYFTENNELTGGKDVERKWQGEDAMLDSLREEPLLAEQLDRQVREVLHLISAPGDAQ